jgi:hypothetical protein
MVPPFQVSNALGRPVPTGVFGADMKVSLVNDGPVTLTLDSQNLEETHMWYVSYSRIPR